jgi:membrane associated rhomboid family serine protease
MKINLTPVVKYLLIINFAVFGISYFLFSQAHIDINAYLGLHPFFSKSFNSIQYLTYMFTHAYVNPYGRISFEHIFSNMFALFMFGPMLEQVWGPKRFLLFYIICGLGAGILYSIIVNYGVYQLKEATEAYLANPNPDAFVIFMKHFGGAAYENNLQLINQFSAFPNNSSLIQLSEDLASQIYEVGANGGMVGASGAIFGVLMGFGMLFPNIEMFLLFLPFPIKAKYLIAGYALWEIFFGLHKTPGDNIAHFAHIGGMIVAFIIIKIWNNQRNTFY